VIGNEVSRWLLSALFGGLGAWYLGAAGRELFPVGRPGRLGPVVGDGLHVAMCAVMIGMSWSWGADIPAIAQVTVFTAGGGWFAGQALFGARTGTSWYQAAMMAAMVWMAVAMSALTTPVTLPVVTAAAAAAPPVDSMSGMAMGSGPDPAMPMGAPAWWVGAGCLLLCVAFFGAALFFAATLWRRRGTLPGAGVGALMAAGMAVTFLQIART